MCGESFNERSDKDWQVNVGPICQLKQMASLKEADKEKLGQDRGNNTFQRFLGARKADTSKQRADDTGCRVSNANGQDAAEQLDSTRGLQIVREPKRHEATNEKVEVGQNELSRILFVQKNAEAVADPGSKRSNVVKSHALQDGEDANGHHRGQVGKVGISKDASRAHNHYDAVKEFSCSGVGLGGLLAHHNHGKNGGQAPQRHQEGQVMRSEDELQDPRDRFSLQGPPEEGEGEAAENYNTRDQEKGCFANPTQSWHQGHEAESETRDVATFGNDGKASFFSGRIIQS